MNSTRVQKIRAAAKFRRPTSRSSVRTNATSINTARNSPSDFLSVLDIKQLAQLHLARVSCNKRIL